MEAAMAVFARDARPARAARLEDLDRDAIAGGYAPPLSGSRADDLDDPDHLVAGNERETATQDAGVLLVIGATESARLDPQQPGIVADLRTGQFVGAKAPRLLEHERGRHAVRVVKRQAVTSMEPFMVLWWISQW
jgi:hypothetical protein